MDGSSGQVDPRVAYQELVRAVTVSPGDAGSWFRLGCALHPIKRWGVSAGCFARADALSPGNVPTLASWGWNLHLVGRDEEALGLLGRAVELGPSEGKVRMQLSQVLLTLGQRERGLEEALRGVQLQPEESVNQVALAFALFENGRWLEGWEAYRGRFDYKLPEFRTRPYPLWRGERVNRLFVEAEQGNGDSIFGARWLAAAKERASQVVFFCHKELLALFREGLDIDIEMVPLPAPLPMADAYCPLLSLPAALGEGFAGPVNCDMPYLRPMWGKDRGRQFDVGIVWAGNADHENAHNRDAHLAYFLRLGEVPGVRLHSLQMGDRSGDLNDLGAGGYVLDRAPEITNFSDTARVLMGLDLVVTVDTSVAHLAGALGVPVWMLVNRRGMDFRWSEGGEKTGWYSSMRIFRRSLTEDWASVLARVDLALRERLG